MAQRPDELTSPVFTNAFSIRKCETWLLFCHAYNTSHTLANRVKQEKDIKFQWAKESTC